VAQSTVCVCVVHVSGVSERVRERVSE
jgi:hypothetical protein